MKHLDILIEQIAMLPFDWHLAGSVSSMVLKKILENAQEIGPIENSVETGSGRTTLFFSHLSENHLVFALDNGNKSISSVKKSELFNANTVTFIEGPTQKTLPQYVFTQKFDMALIDGAHGYPFPDLDYYYFYPNIKKGGLLLIDDIQIPSIRRMFEIINADDMFELLEVVREMAFFRRTDHPLIDPCSDSWWLQGYNRSHYQKICELAKLKNQKMNRVENLKRIVPDNVIEYIPGLVKKWINRLL